MPETKRQREQRLREQFDRAMWGSWWAKVAWFAFVLAGLAFPTAGFFIGPPDFSAGPTGVNGIITYCAFSGFLLFAAVMTPRVTRLCWREPRMRWYRIWLAFFIVGLLLLDVLLPILGPLVLGMTRADSIGLAVVAFPCAWIVAFSMSLLVWLIAADRDEERV